MSDDELLEVMDALPLSIMQEWPGVTYPVEVARVTGFRSDVIPSPYVNLVGRTRANSDTIEETIDRVYQAYDGMPFGWIIGPLSTPPDLRRNLEHQGMVYYDHPMQGMALDDLTLPVPANSAIRVTRVTPREAVRHAEHLASCFGMGMTPEAVQYMFLGYRDTQVYLAFSDADAVPVGFATLTAVSSEVVLLGGAAVSEAWRGQHVYKTLVKNRLEDARRMGATTAVIQAVADTAAPICQGLGFREICQFDVYLGHLELLG